MKKMFVVMEVKNVITYESWVRPKDGCFKEDEWIHKSRVIYADEMESKEFHDKKWFSFFGVSPTPEPEDEWEKWIQACPVNPGVYWTTNDVQDWLRKMPKREKP